MVMNEQSTREILSNSTMSQKMVINRLMKVRKIRDMCVRVLPACLLISGLTYLDSIKEAYSK